MNLTTTQASKNTRSVFSHSREILSSPSIPTNPVAFLEFSLDSLLDFVNAHAGSLLLWDDASKHLTLKAARGPQREKVTNVQVKLREGISGWVGDQGRSVLVKDIQEDDRFQGLKRSGQYGTPSFISIPLLVHNRLIGVLNITEKETREPFTDSEFEKAQLFANNFMLTYEQMIQIQQLTGERDELREKIEKLENCVYQQEPLVGVGKLAANLAHELNNPLDSIRRYVNLAIDQVDEDTLSKEYLVKAKRGIRRAIQVIRGLLQYSRECSKTSARYSELHFIIDQSLEAISHDHSYDQIEIEKNLGCESVFVSDCGINFVFNNLFKNANQAMNGKGKIKIVTRTQGSKALIEISDSGSGISDDVKSRLFEPFFTTKKEEGTGIGLTLCREIIDKSGGDIVCVDGEEGGAKFIITLPCREDE